MTTWESLSLTGHVTMFTSPRSLVHTESRQRSYLEKGSGTGTAARRCEASGNSHPAWAAPPHPPGVPPLRLLGGYAAFSHSATRWQQSPTDPFVGNLGGQAPSRTGLEDERPRCGPC